MTRKIITVQSLAYLDYIIPELLEEAFKVYKAKDFGKRFFQVSSIENTYSSAGILLSVFALESLRNMVYYHKKIKIGSSWVDDLNKILSSYITSYDKIAWFDVLKEVNLLRDLLAHNHLYEVVYELKNGKFTHKQHLQQGYFYNKKQYINILQPNKLTKNLKLNIQPLKIGFEDYLKILIIVESILQLSKTNIPHAAACYPNLWKISNIGYECMGISLGYYFNNCNNPKYIKSINKIFGKLATNENPNISSYGESFFKSRCPKCKSFGYIKPDMQYYCSICGHTTN